MRNFMSVAAMILIGAAPLLAQEPSANELMARAGAYAAAYGEKSSVVVAVETYTQYVSVEGAPDMPRPIKLVAEFAIVKLEGGGWTGFRDVLEVNGEAVRDRRDRLAALLTSASASVSEATRIANESARFNVGPISRNFNTPTAALFFFLPQNLDRFTFSKKGAKTIDGTRTFEIAYKETKLPSIVTTRGGNNVPLEGSLFVTEDGTVIRTRMRMEKFADAVGAPTQMAPKVAGPLNPSSNNGGREGLASSVAGPSLIPKPIDSSADIEVTYAKPAGIDLWLPQQMVELYEGPINLTQRVVSGRSSTKASYSQFKQFGAAGKIVPQ